MFGKVAAFEYRYQTGSPVFWVTTLLFALLSWALVASDNVSLGGIGAVHENSPYVIVLANMAFTPWFMFVTTAFVANVVIRDDETGFGSIVRSTSVSKFDYLFGRFTGAFLAAATAYLAVCGGIFLGTLMPWVDQDTLGPNQLSAYAYGFLVMGVPGVLFTSALFFTISTVTRSMMLSYVAAVGVLVILLVTQGALGRKPEFDLALAYGEPFGGQAFTYVTKYWTVADKNGLLPPLTGVLLINRLIVIGLSFGLLVLGYHTFQAGTRGAKLKKQEKLKAMAEQGGATPVMARGSLPKPTSGASTTFTQMVERTRFEFALIFRSPAYFILLLIGLLFAGVNVWFGGEVYGTELYPVTYSLIGTLSGSFFLIAAIVATYYAGELVWRERDRKVHEIIGASAISDGAFIFPKMFALVLVMISTVFAGMVAGVLVQSLKGYTHYEFGKYLLWFVVPQSIDFSLIAVLALFLAAVSPHKFVGWGLMVVYLIASIFLGNLGYEHNLYNYGSGPGTPLSDMNAQGQFWKGAYWLRAYWSAFAVLLSILSYGLWRRGVETRLAPRLARLPRLLKGPTGAVAAVALLIFLGVGVYVFMNTNVWNDYRTRLSEEKWQAAYERALLRFEHTPQPVATAVRMDVQLFPHQSRLIARGSYQIVNQTAQPLGEVHLRVDQDVKLKRLEVQGAKLKHDYAGFNYRIYAFDQPMAPGEHRTVSFETEAGQKGFKNSGNTTRLVDNGTFISSFEFAPMIGMSRSGLITERARRKKLKLTPVDLRLPVLSADPAMRTKNYLGGDWVTADITVTTDADQTPVAPGYVVSDSKAGGRRTVRFVTETPILQFFSIQSARYVEKRERYKDVDLVVYYDPQHPYNVDRMLTALRTGLDYYQANFAPYQFKQARITEFPDYGKYAQSYPNTFAWSEGLGFTADVRDKEKIDFVTYVAAHEFAHQWWAHQIIGAEMQGETSLSETLAQYSAIMVMEKLYGPAQIRKFLKYELDRYLRGRGSDRIGERSLMTNENQQYIHYNKGSLVMYLLKDEIGEEAVNRALRRLLAQYAFKGAPYPTSLDLVAALRAEAPADKQQLITDLFEKITLYDLKTTALTSKKRPDGRYDVSLTITARKLYADDKGKETAASLDGESFDVGLFTAEPGKKRFGQGNVLLFEKRPLKSGPQTFTFVTSGPPKFGGVDPYNKRIDRDSNDNVKAAG